MKDGRDGTYHFTGGTVDALVRVDVVLRSIVGTVDAIDRADIDAGRVFDADTRLRDDVWHWLPHAWHVRTKRL